MKKQKSLAYNNENKKEVRIDGSIHVVDHIRLKTPPRC